MLEIECDNRNEVRFGKRFSLSFQRTLRLPVDDNEYALPAGLGRFPIYKVSDYLSTVPFSWIKSGGGVFIPMYQSEAMWINFEYPKWKPHALKIGAGRVNVINGKPLVEQLVPGENDYMTCPNQSWIDGFNLGDGTVRQFVATPLGSGKSVEAQITGQDRFGGLQVIVYAPKPGLFPDEPPPPPPVRYSGGPTLYQSGYISPMLEMGLAAGGVIKQKIYPDKYGFTTWDSENYGRLEIHIVNSLAFHQITGQLPPTTPINAKLYKEAGFSWFKLFDDEYSTLDSTATLSGIKPITD